MKTSRSFASKLMLSFTLSAIAAHSPFVLALGGEDHGDGAASVATAQPLAPRAEAKSDDVELLAVHGDKELTLYLSRFKTNEPIADAQIEIESGSEKALAKPVAAGVYKVSTPWLAKPGKYGLVATVQGNDIADLLETSLEIKADSQPNRSDTIAGVAPAAMLGALGGIAMLGVLFFFLRRRRK